jgi:2-polyprenyl-6-methoxyphenol hydroxylase-like FAD-dependent oxidoreductase
MTTSSGHHAVVIGAGIAGLLAARALADAYEHVTIVERDALPAGDEPRRAVPQGRHVHALLPGGQDALERLLPGLAAELAAGGAVEYRALRDVRFSVAGHLLARGDAGRASLVASRPFVEGHVRRRVAALGNVELVDRCDVTGLVPSPGGAAVAGVRVRPRTGGAEHVMPADLVVAATGRGGRLSGWVEELGFGRPPTDRVDVELRYASRPLRLAPGAISDKLVLVGARPGLPRSMALFAQEDGRWLLTLGGYAPERPPLDPEEFDAYAATVAPPDVLAALRGAEPLGDIVPFRFPANVRHRWERLERLPGRLLPIGDAICAFNPVYGQGMSVAAREAVALSGCLATGDVRPERFLAAVRPVVDDAWQMATGADLAHAWVEGPRPAAVRVVGAYMRRLQAAAEHDPEVAAAFIRAVGMLDRPRALLRPAIAWRVLGPRRRRGAPAPGPAGRERALETPAPAGGPR